MQLTNDQQSALNLFNAFLYDPIETVFVLSGYSGTGKSTLVKELLRQMPNALRAMKLLNPKLKEYEVALTATTNKAAENLSLLTGQEVKTIHQFLGLSVQTDYKTGVTSLMARRREKAEGYLLFIDEASYIDRQLLDFIFSQTKDCKVVFIGDPAQLTPVKSNHTPVFQANFSGATLTQVVRQAAGNPIVELATKFRETVSTGEFFTFTPDGHAIKYMTRADFNDAIKKEFTRPDWKHLDSKVLAWTNKTVINYNHHVSDIVSNTPDFKANDYAVVNSFISSNRINFKTDEVVVISEIHGPVIQDGVKGKLYIINAFSSFFMPDSLADKKALIKKAKAEGDVALLHRIDTTWIDLRAAYACTINKSQGSTYDKVFIDLDDVRKCNSGDQLARLLYVGVSRAKTQVFLTGDIA